MNISISISHTPWRQDRRDALTGMLRALSEELIALGPAVTARVWVHDADYRGQQWQSTAGKVAWARKQWQWHADGTADWCLLMTDDLHLAPRFLECLSAMLRACSHDCPIGLLSNHPRAAEFAASGWRWYATNSWLVGPAYILNRMYLRRFLEWYEALPDERQVWFNDDSAVNEFTTHHGGGRTVHPLPTLIEHRADLASTVGHGDQFSRERVSWREVRWTEERAGGFDWCAMARVTPVERMVHPEFWLERGGPSEAPMMGVGG